MALGPRSQTTLPCFVFLASLASVTAVGAQPQPPASALMPVPRVIWFNGVFRPADGGPLSPVETVTVAVYPDREGGAPLWQETQTVALRADGRYDLLLGSTTSDGMPLDLFTAGEPRWIGVRFLRGNEIEQPRVHLASVPYALKAADADTLGGKPLSAFVLAEPSAATSAASRSNATEPAITLPVSGTGLGNQVTKWLDLVGTLGNSAITESAGNVGIGTVSPQGRLHLFGSATTDIFAGMGPDLISGPAFNYGYAGTSFGRGAGFFNVRPDASAVAPNPSLRFMTGNVQRMIVSNTGNVGIGVAVPASKLDVSGDIGFTGRINWVGGFPVLRFDNDGLGLGPGSLASSTGAGNVGVGYGELEANTTGAYNVAVGQYTLAANVSGWSNTAVGASALTGNMVGGQNTALGYFSLLDAGGSRNTAVGFSTLSDLVTGDNNIAIGWGAGSSDVSNGSNNIYLGSPGFGSESGAIRIGWSATHTSLFAAGVRGVTTGINDAVPVVIDSAGQLGTVSSSRRFKEDIHDMGDASRALFGLRPVTFRYKNPFADGSKPIQYGLIAEEVAEVYPDLVAHSADGQIETVKYQVLDVLLLNELQRQQAGIRALEEQNRDLKQRLEKLEAVILRTRR